jgi:serine/threonine protein phosphatase PrpC
MSTPLSPVRKRLVTPVEPPSASAAGPAGDPSLDANAHGLEAAVASACGSLHAVNEDAHSPLAGDGRLFVVADGVGGGAMAQTASRLLVTGLHASLDGGEIDAARVRQALLDADRRIAAAIARVTDRPGAATVALCAPVDASAARWLVAWVGDCRVYRLSFGGETGLDLLTRDDTFANLRESPPSGGSPDDPARMVGNGAIGRANVALHELARGDLLALCSDGVHRFVDVADWCRLLAQPGPLARRCDALIAQARANGSKDDATILVLRRAPAAPSGLRRVGGMTAVDAAAPGSRP